ncbi:MAG: hypothetical protein WC759_05840, partial [Candidatus Micrarchaeia archaeon]
MCALKHAPEEKPQTPPPQAQPEAPKDGFLSSNSTGSQSTVLSGKEEARTKLNELRSWRDSDPTLTPDFWKGKSGKEEQKALNDSLLRPEFRDLILKSLSAAEQYYSKAEKSDNLLIISENLASGKREMEYAADLLNIIGSYGTLNSLQERGNAAGYVPAKDFTDGIRSNLGSVYSDLQAGNTDAALSLFGGEVFPALQYLSFKVQAAEALDYAQGLSKEFKGAGLSPPPELEKLAKELSGLKGIGQQEFQESFKEGATGGNYFQRFGSVLERLTAATNPDALNTYVSAEIGKMQAAADSLWALWAGQVDSMNSAIDGLAGLSYQQKKDLKSGLSTGLEDARAAGDFGKMKEAYWNTYVELYAQSFISAGLTGESKAIVGLRGAKDDIIKKIESLRKSGASGEDSAEALQKVLQPYLTAAQADAQMLANAARTYKHAQGVGLRS